MFVMFVKGIFMDRYEIWIEEEMEEVEKEEEMEKESMKMENFKIRCDTGRMDTYAQYHLPAIEEALSRHLFY